MATVRDLIKGSLKLIGASASGETPSADEQADGLSALNGMLGSWSTENLAIYAKTRESLALVSGTQSYTIGSSGVFNTARPLKIEHATISDPSISPAVESPLDLLTIDQWADVAVKAVGSAFPVKLYYEATNPLGTVYLWPKPAAAYNLILYSLKPLTTFTSVSTTLTFPPGYEEALRFNLAIRLAPEYGKAVPVEVLAVAEESKANIKRMNIKTHLLEPGIGGRSFNILTGE